MSNDDRIRIALTMGWSETAPGEVNTAWHNGKKLQCEPPDPFTDERHCHALIKHLNGLGWIVTVHYGLGEKDQVQFWLMKDGIAHEDNTWEGDNWMHGVCELALKVIE